MLFTFLSVHCKFFLANANHYHYDFRKGKFMKNKYIIAPGIAVICSAVISSGYASSDKKEDTLVVTASGFTQQLRNAPASVSVITSEQLQKNRFQTWSMR